MPQTLQTMPIVDGVTLYALQDSKFKSNRISLNFLLPLSEATASANAIVPMILSKGCKLYPDFTSLNCKLENLYGSWIDSSVKKYKEKQVLSLSVGGVDNAYALHGEDILGDLCDLATAAVFSPVLDENGAFPQDTFLLEQQNLLDAIASIINNKRYYTLYRLNQEVYQNEVYGLCEYGTEKSVRALTPAAATDAYRNMLRNAEVVIQFTGCGDPQCVADKMKAAFFEYPRMALPQSDALPDLSKLDAKTVTERLDLAQSKLALGFSVDPAYRDNHTALYLMSMVLGGTPSSLLFQQVREKQSLCYYCAARYLKQLSLVVVDSGIEHNKAERTKAAILEQLDAVKSGSFTDKDLEETLLAAINSYRTVGDSLSAVESYYWGKIMEQDITSPEEQIAKLREVTKEQIVEAAEHLSLNTVFLLTGLEGNA